MESTTEEMPPPLANGSADETSVPASTASTASAERDEEKGDTLDTTAPLSRSIQDEKAKADVRGVAAVAEEPAKRKSKTALIMLAICVRKV